MRRSRAGCDGVHRRTRRWNLCGPGARERLRRQRGLPLSSACWYVPASAGRGAGRRQAPARKSRSLSRRSGRRVHAEVKLPATPIDKFGVFAQDAGGISPSPMPFRVSRIWQRHRGRAERYASRPRRTAELPLALNGVIAKPGDVDYFRFNAKKGQTFDVHCYARRIGSPLDLGYDSVVFQRRCACRATMTPSARTAISASPSPEEGVRPECRRPLGQRRPDLFLSCRVHAGAGGGDGEHPQGGAVLARTADNRRAARQSHGDVGLTSAGPISAANCCWSAGTAGGDDDERREHGRESRRGAGRFRGDPGRPAGRELTALTAQSRRSQAIDRKPFFADRRVGDWRTGTIRVLEREAAEPRWRSRPSRLIRSALLSRKCRWCRTAP